MFSSICATVIGSISMTVISCPCLPSLVDTHQCVHERTDTKSDHKPALRLYRGMQVIGWLCGTVVELRSLTGELSLSCARPAADG